LHKLGAPPDLNFSRFI